LVGLSGAQVLVADRNGDSAADAAHEINLAGGTAIALAADVTSESDVGHMLDTAVATFGGVDGAFNNAGIATTGSYSFGTPLRDIDVTDFRALIEVNLVGMFLCLKHELKIMRGPHASIVNNASIAGLVGLSGRSPYVASKHGAAGLTKAAALEAAEIGVRVNSVCPGFVETPMLQPPTSNTAPPNRAAAAPLGRVARASEVAELVSWLLSPASSYMTGVNVPIDGGISAGTPR